MQYRPNFVSGRTKTGWNEVRKGLDRTFDGSLNSRPTSSSTMPPPPTVAAAVRSSTPRAKSSVSTPPTWTDSPEALLEFPSTRSVPCCKKLRSSSKISYFPPPAPVLARLISLPRIRLFIRDARAPLESPPQRELDQPWVAGGLGDF